MSLSVPSSNSQIHSRDCTAPRWGAWSAFLIVGCFYLTQSMGMFMVHIVARLGAGFSQQGVVVHSEMDQGWLLPLSLFAATMGAALVSLQVASSRAKLSRDSVWLWEFIGQSYDYRGLWRFVLLGLGLGFGFFALTEYGVLPSDDLPQPIFDTLWAAPILLQIGWVLMFVILFPVVEEILFRGFLFAGLAQSWGPTLAGIVTTALFVAVHMPKVLEYWPALIAVMLIGTLTVLIRIRTGSLAPGIALHSTYNGVLITVAFFTNTIA